MPRQRLKRLINSQQAATPILPLLHTTDVYRFTNVLEDGQLEPRACPVFKGEPLLYFFYGRPSYRANPKEEATGLDHYLPVCLLFRAQNVTPIKRIFPFDSGGFDAQLYSDADHYQEVDTYTEVQIGERALWGFRSLTGQIILGPMKELSKTLKIRLANNEYEKFPFIEAQVARFCDSTKAYHRALKKSYTALRSLSELSADIWRDSVIILPEAKKELSKFSLLSTIKAGSRARSRCWQRASNRIAPTGSPL